MYSGILSNRKHKLGTCFMKVWSCIGLRNFLNENIWNYKQPGEEVSLKISLHMDRFFRNEICGNDMR